MSRITFTADDFGINAGIDNGILKCANEGRIQNIALSPFATPKMLDNSQLATLRKCSLGVHWFLFPLDINVNKLSDVLSAWKSFWPSTEIVNNHLKELSNFVNLWKNSGHKIVFINGHQHLHLLPGWSIPLCKWAEANSIPLIRLPKELGEQSHQARRERPTIMAMEFFGRLSQRLTKNIQVKWQPAIIRYSYKFNLKTILSEMQSTSSNIEIVTHPGLPSVQNYKHWGIEHVSQVNQLCRADYKELISEFSANICRMSDFIL